MDERHARAQPAQLVDDRGAVRRVPLDRLELVGVQARGLRQDRVGHGELADVVEETGVAERVQPVGRQAELFADRERDLLHALRVPGRVGVLRLDGGVQRLDRLERALLEAVVRLQQLARAPSQSLRLAAQELRGAANEERERDVEGEEDARDDSPEDVAPRRDEVLERVRVGVDLVGADRPAGAAGRDRRVDLEHVVEAEAPLDGVLLAGELVDRAGGAAGLERPREVAVDLEATADAGAVAIRPRQDAVGAPDLDRHEVGLPVEAREQARRLGPDPDPPVADDRRPDDALGVGDERRLRVFEGLGTQGGRERPTEDDAGDEEDGGARDEEDAQQRQRALERLPLPRMRGRPRSQRKSSRAVSAAARGRLILQT